MSTEHAADVSGAKHDFYATLNLAISGTRLYTTTTSRMQAREWAKMLRVAANNVDPDYHTVT